MRTAVIIIAFNDTRLIEKQLELIDKFCIDKPDIIIFDNSNIECVNVANKSNHIYYNFVDGYYLNPSDSHSNAANAAYKMFSPSYDKLLFLDHDCFPIKTFSVNEILRGCPVAGIGQEKTKLYLWPGCVAFYTKKLKRFPVDFSTNQEYGLDTGGNLFRVLERFPTVFLNEECNMNPYFTEPPYNFYSTIHNGTFMHFTNASNWNNTPLNEQRIETLYKILEEKTV
jgi:hypothetical protein